METNLRAILVGVAPPSLLPCMADSVGCITAGCVNLSFAYVEGESLLMALKDVALSSGRSAPAHTHSHMYARMHTHTQCMHLSLSGAVVCAEGSGGRRGSGPLLHQVRHREVHHRRGGGLYCGEMCGQCHPSQGDEVRVHEHNMAVMYVSHCVLQSSV